MNEWINIGKIVNTHGIKGELRILSDFEKKDIVFQMGFSIYIGQEKRKEIINSYRHHKNFEMITYQGITNINEVLKDIGLRVYIKREDLNLKEQEYLLSDLVGYNVMEDEKNLGKVVDVVYNKAGILLAVRLEQKEYYIPKNEAFIVQVDLRKKIIFVQNAQGLIL